MSSVQKYCETIEKYLEKDCEENKLPYKVFHAMNFLLLELNSEGLYKRPSDQTDERIFISDLGIDFAKVQRHPITISDFKASK